MTMTLAARFLPILLATVFASFNVQAERIAVIGTGSVGSTLGQEFGALGHDIIYGSRSPEREDVKELVKNTENASIALPAAAVKDADIVVLGIPGLKVEEITESLGTLDGKILIDPTNPLIGWEENNLTLRKGPSNAELIQAVAPKAHVVKAFSTLNVQQMRQPEESAFPISILLAGDDDAAKTKVAELAAALGLHPIDVGDISAASYVEGMAVLLLNNRIQGRQRFDFHLTTE